MSRADAMRKPVNMGMGNIGNTMMNQFFRKVNGVKWDLMSGKVGVQTDEGIVSLVGEGEDAYVELNVIEQFSMPIPAFAQNTPIESVAVNDLIYQGTKVKGWVTEVMTKKDDDTVKTGKFRLMSDSGTSSVWTPPKVNMFGINSGVMVLRSLMNMLPSEDGKNLGAMQNVLLPMMVLGNGNMDMDNIMPFMLFSQLGASGTGADAMGLNGNMMNMMMMANMMGGNNNMGNMFGGNNSGTGFFGSN